MANGLKTQQSRQYRQGDGLCIAYFIRKNNSIVLKSLH